MKRRAYQKIICLVWSRSAEHTFFSHVNVPCPPSAVGGYPPPTAVAASFNSPQSAFQLYKFHPFHLRPAFIIRNASFFAQQMMHLKVLLFSSRKPKGGLASRGVSASGWIRLETRAWIPGGCTDENKPWHLGDRKTIKSNCYGKNWPHVLRGSCMEFFLRVGAFLLFFFLFFFFDQRGNSWGLNCQWFISRKMRRSSYSQMQQARKAIMPVFHIDFKASSPLPR